MFFISLFIISLLELDVKGVDDITPLLHEDKVNKDKNNAK